MAMRSSEEFEDIASRGYLYMNEFGGAPGVTGERQRNRIGRLANDFVRVDGMDVIT